MLASNFRFLFVLFTFLLSGCSAMQLNAPASLENQLGASQDILAQYPGNPNWWEVYEDVQLNSLVEQARANNIDLAKSAIVVNKALYQANKSGTNLLPSLSGQSSASVSETNGQGTSTKNSSSLSLSYELDLWGKLSDSADAQEWEYKASKEDLESAWLTLANSVVDSYFSLASIHASIKTGTENRDYYQKLLEIKNQKYALGKIDGLEKAQAEQALLNAENTLVNYQISLKQEEQNLRNLLNLRPEDPLNLTFPDITQLTLSTQTLDIPLAVLANRPDLKAAEYRVFKSLDSAKASQKQLYPSITIGAAAQSSGTNLNLFSIPLLSSNISISLPFLNWNSLQWDIKSSEADFESAKLNFEQALTTALNEVSLAWVLYEKSLEVYALSEKKLSEEEKIVAYYEKRYKAGTTEWADYLQALVSLNSTKLSLLEQKVQIISYINSIYKSMGAEY